jgi:hypothetical protein
MGRFIVLFLVVGAVVMFLLVLNTPPQMIRESYLYQRYLLGSQQPAEEVEPEPIAAARPSAKRTIAQTTRQVAVSSAPDDTVAEPLSPPRIEYPAATPAKNQPSGVVSMNSDALVYSSNSTNAPILKVLNKGQVVEVDMEFITPGGRWALVTIPNEEISGFVRTDGLALKRPNGAAPVTATVSESGQ